ncbi:MAG: aldo/keto reductase, partial [Gemmatimonadetes bacterium 21-71-4]
RALDLGITFFDTADMYGSGANEELLGRAFGARRASVVLATKFGITRDPSNPAHRGFNGAPDYAIRACDASLTRLRTDHIDLYYLHRVAITALQSEYSLWTRDPEDGVLAACRALGVGFVPYSPLGRGFLSGQLKNPDDFAADDFRRIQPRFQGENFRRNLDLVAAVERLAARKGTTAAQLALAWVLAQGDDIVPIPGTKRVKYLEDNVAAVELKLTPTDLAALDAAFPRSAVAGERYQTQAMAALDR